MFFLWISNLIFAEYTKHAFPIVLVLPGWKRPFLSLDVNLKQIVSELIQNIWWCCSSKTCLLYTKSGSNYNIFSISVFFLWISNLIFAEYKKNALPIVIAILIFLNINVFFMWISNLIFAKYKNNALLIVPLMFGLKRPFLSLDVNWQRTVSELLPNIWWRCSSKAYLLYTKSGSNLNFFGYPCLFFWISNLLYAEYKKNALPIVLAILIFLNIKIFFMRISNLIFAEYIKNALLIVLLMLDLKRPFLSLDVNWKRTVSEMIQNMWYACSSKACLLYTKSGSNYNFFEYPCLFFVNFKFNILYNIKWMH